MKPVFMDAKPTTTGCRSCAACHAAVDRARRRGVARVALLLGLPPDGYGTGRGTYDLRLRGVSLENGRQDQSNGD